jgi:hypothetical protein
VGRGVNAFLFKQGRVMTEIKLVRARAAAMSSIGVLLHHDRESLMQILGWVKDHLLEEEAQATKALFLANQAIRKAQNGKA